MVPDRRFETERQALAMMDHPTIARVFDAGETTDGRPHLVMEHIQGEPITKYCDTQRLSTPDRLKLYIQVCGRWVEDLGCRPTLGL